MKRRDIAGENYCILTIRTASTCTDSLILIATLHIVRASQVPWAWNCVIIARSCSQTKNSIQQRIQQLFFCNTNQHLCSSSPKWLLVAFRRSAIVSNHIFLRQTSAGLETSAMGQADAEPTMVEEKVEKVEKEPGGRRNGPDPGKKAVI